MCVMNILCTFHTSIYLAMQHSDAIKTLTITKISQHNSGIDLSEKISLQYKTRNFIKKDEIILQNFSTFTQELLL